MLFNFYKMPFICFFSIFKNNTILAVKTLQIFYRIDLYYFISKSLEFLFCELLCLFFSKVTIRYSFWYGRLFIVGWTSEKSTLCFFIILLEIYFERFIDFCSYFFLICYRFKSSPEHYGNFKSSQLFIATCARGTMVTAVGCSPTFSRFDSWRALLPFLVSWSDVALVANIS